MKRIEKFLDFFKSKNDENKTKKKRFNKSWRIGKWLIYENIWSILQNYDNYKTIFYVNLYKAISEMKLKKKFIKMENTIIKQYPISRESSIIS